MQMVKKILLGLVLFWFALIVLMPKEELYFGLERELAKQGIEINESTIKESMFGLTLENVTVYFQGIKAVHIEEISLFTLLAYTRIEAKEVHTDQGMQAFFSAKMSDLVLYHSVLSPLHLFLQADGTLGSLKGDISLKERKVHIEFDDEKKIRALKRMLKKGEKGWYYETEF